MPDSGDNLTRAYLRLLRTTDPSAAVLAEIDRLEGRPVKTTRKCVGVIGLLAGHRFNDMGFRPTTHCQRCGMPQGGWPTPALG